MSIDLEILSQELQKNSQDLSQEFRRLFHGRGGLWEELRFLTVDSIDTVLLVQFFYDAEKEVQQRIINLLQTYLKTSRHTAMVLKHRYGKNRRSEIITGELPSELYAIENGIKFSIDLLSNQNIGYFGDMKNGRSFIESIAKGKRVLNLFSYTCGFSLFAKRGGAKEIVNVDMSKSALATGMKNHHLNNFETKGVSFLPYNILKSFPKLKRKAPFDIIIIDPPSYQKGSFIAHQDYEKIIKRLPELAAPNATLLACLNAPELDENFLTRQITTFAPEFVFLKRLENLKEYKSLDEQRSLKNLVFQREI